MAKNVEDVKKEVEGAIENVADDVQDAAKDIEDEVTKPKWYQKINWKRLGIDAALFVAGVVAKAGFDYFTGSSVEVPALDVKSNPDVSGVEVTNF